MGNFFIVLLILFLFFLIIGALADKYKTDDTKKYTFQRNFDYEKNVTNDIDKILSSKPDKPQKDVISIVGGFYRSWEAKQCIRKLYACETVFLKEEPDNPYDPNAIMVLSKKGLHIGYVSKYDIQTVKNRMSEGLVKGSVYDTMDSRYEYLITLLPMEEGDEEYNNAIYFFNERKKKEEDTIKINRLRDKLNFNNALFLSERYVSSKNYSSIYRMMKPIFDANVQNDRCYLFMILSCHYLRDYESELKYIDKYIDTGNVYDIGFFNRRKYQVLRLLGHLVSNDQIENEKAGVETTILELDFFNSIVSLLSDVVDPNRIDFRDGKSLFSVNLDSNVRRPICKLYLNNPDKMFIGLINDDGSVLKVQINDIADLDELKDDLLKPINKFLNNTQDIFLRKL